MSLAQHLIHQKQVETRPPKHMATHPDDARNEEMDTKVQTVVEILEAQGHCPVTKLIEASKSEDLSPQHQAAVNRWLMEHAYAKPKSVEISGKDGGPIPLVLSEADERI